MATIDVKGIKEYQKRVLLAENILKDFERQFLEELANMVMQRVIPRTPVDTGRLRRSWKVSKVEEKGGYVQITIYNDARDNGTDESYASYVEKGHYTRNRSKWIKGVRMLTISTDQVKALMIKKWNQMYREYVRKAEL